MVILRGIVWEATGFITLNEKRESLVKAGDWHGDDQTTQRLGGGGTTGSKALAWSGVVYECTFVSWNVELSASSKIRHLGSVSQSDPLLPPWMRT